MINNNQCKRQNKIKYRKILEDSTAHAQIVIQ